MLQHRIMVRASLLDASGFMDPSGVEGPVRPQGDVNSITADELSRQSAESHGGRVLHCLETEQVQHEELIVHLDCIYLVLIHG